jgi:hypothetical protein
MLASIDSPSRNNPLRRLWPWLLLGVMTLPAVWHVVHFPDDVDIEFPRVLRPTMSAFPPPAYRLAEPGDTIDRIAIYVSSLAIVLSASGLWQSRGSRRPWVAALALSLAAFWYGANPGPTFDGWHGLGWTNLLNAEAPAGLRLGLATAAASLAVLVVRAVGVRPASWLERWRTGRSFGVAGLLTVAAVLTISRAAQFPDVEPLGYWPRWAFVWALVAFCAALVRVLPRRKEMRSLAVVGVGAGSVAVWFGLVVAGVTLSWYHRPIDRFREVVPGKIYISAMPTARGLEVVHSRHHFKTILNLFPEDTPYRSPRLPEEMRFVEQHGLRYYGSPADPALSNDFLDLTLRVAQDQDAWPILVHCHGCMDRTPAWVGIYRFVVEGRPLGEILRFIEGHRGYRPKASVTLLYNRVLSRLAPDRYRDDPTAALLRRCARGTIDPEFEMREVDRARSNPEASTGVGTASAGSLPSLTPRR